LNGYGIEGRDDSKKKTTQRANAWSLETKTRASRDMDGLEETSDVKNRRIDPKDIERQRSYNHTFKKQHSQDVGYVVLETDAPLDLVSALLDVMECFSDEWMTCWLTQVYLIEHEMHYATLLDGGTAYANDVLLHSSEHISDVHLRSMVINKWIQTLKAQNEESRARMKEGKPWRCEGYRPSVALAWHVGDLSRAKFCTESTTGPSGNASATASTRVVGSTCVGHSRGNHNSVKGKKTQCASQDGRSGRTRRQSPEREEPDASHHQKQKQEQEQRNPRMPHAWLIEADFVRSIEHAALASSQFQLEQEALRASDDQRLSREEAEHLDAKDKSPAAREARRKTYEEHRRLIGEWEHELRGRLTVHQGRNERRKTLRSIEDVAQEHYQMLGTIYKSNYWREVERLIYLHGVEYQSMMHLEQCISACLRRYLAHGFREGVQFEVRQRDASYLRQTTPKVHRSLKLMSGRLLSEAGIQDVSFEWVSMADLSDNELIKTHACCHCGHIPLFFKGVYSSRALDKFFCSYACMSLAGYKK